MGERHAIRDGDWKVTVEPGTPPALFNLATDPGEKTDLAAKQPERMQELVGRYAAWSSGMATPAWERGASNRNAAAPKEQGAAANRLEQRFKALDKNGDGMLTPDEFTRAKVFAQMDTDRNGKISLDEAKAALVRQEVIDS